RRLHEWQTRQKAGTPPIVTVPTQAVAEPAPSPAAPHSHGEVEIGKLSASLAAARSFHHWIAHAVFEPHQTQTNLNNLGLPPTGAAAGALLLEPLNPPDVETTVELAQAVSLMTLQNLIDLVTYMLSNSFFDADHYGQQIDRQLTTEES